MPVLRSNSRRSGSLRRSLTLAALLLCVSFAFAKDQNQPLRIPLEPLGFLPGSPQFLQQGSSLFTVHFVDDTHLLLTYTAHRLLTHLSDEREGDRDRYVDALLLELPTGNVLARASWRLRDHGQYLWDLGHGHFLLRVRDRLTTIAPLANLASGHSFSERPFLNLPDRRLAAILLSPTANLLILETVPRTQAKVTFVESSQPQDPVLITFLRIATPSETSEEVRVSPAGAVRSDSTGNIASISAGYLSILDQGNQHWAFDFNSYTGKTAELAPFDSTCRPSPSFVSRSEFIAFGCRSGASRQLLGGFNMRGEEMWEQGLDGEYVSPTLAFAPASGRFALSRILTHSAAIGDIESLVGDDSTQTLVVYQTGTGKQLLQVNPSPTERAGQNFTLSPNGLALAFIHNDVLEIDPLPPLTSQEDEAVKKAEASAPEENDAPIRFASAHRASTTSAPATSSPAINAPAYIQQAEQPAANLPVPPASDPSTSAGDAPPGQPRKPPTLYTLPTDPPHVPAEDQPRQHP